MAPVLWNVDPNLWQWGSVSIRWYSVWTAVGLVLGHHAFRYMWRLEGRDPKEADLILVVSVFCSVVGARLGHCLLYQPQYYLAHPLDIFKLWQGGLASHGGFLGLFAGFALLLRVLPPISFLQLADRFMIPASFVSVGLRIGNLFNSEIYGRPTEVPWAFVFARVDQIPRHPTQIYEALAYALILVVLALLYAKPRYRSQPGFILGASLVLYPSFRIVIEFFKEGQTPLDQNWLFSMGQWLSLPFWILGVLLLSGVQRHSPRWFSGALDLRSKSPHPD